MHISMQFSEAVAFLSVTRAGIKSFKKLRKKCPKTGSRPILPLFEKSKFFDVFFENPKIKVAITRAEDQMKPVTISSTKIMDLCGGGEEERNLVCLKAAPGRKKKLHDATNLILAHICQQNASTIIVAQQLQTTKITWC